MISNTLEAAITTALLDFYTHQGDLIAKAVAEFQAQHAADSSRLRDELAAVTRELKDTSAAIDWYLIAFEKGTLDDEDSHVRDRLAALKAQSKQLRGRKAQLRLILTSHRR
jgi:site-specific DNA recombinase